MARCEARNVMFSGAVGVREAPVLHAELVAALEAADVVRVDVSDVSEVDLSVLQLLIAARRSAEARGKALVLAGPAPPPVQEALRRGGLPTDDPLWSGEGEES